MIRFTMRRDESWRGSALFMSRMHTCWSWPKSIRNSCPPSPFTPPAQMLQRHPNFYGDNSAFNVPIRGRHVPECLAEPVASRILHGSDFPVPVMGHWSWLRRFIDWDDFRRCEHLPNVLERDYQLKRAM